MVKNDGFTKTFRPSKFMSCSNKKNNSFCRTKYPTKEQAKKYKRKMSQWINDDKSVYICEDLAYKIICYIILGVIEADEFRKNLAAKNDQSVWIEREMIATAMRIFAKENIIRQYKIPGLPYLVDLCFIAPKLVIEIDEDGHHYYEKDEIKQKLIENLGFTFIRINLDPDPDAVFDPDVEIARICDYINESSVKLSINSAKKSLKEKFKKELLTYILHVKHF